MFIGERLNAYEDALDVADYLDRWINPYVAGVHDGPDDLAEAMAGRSSRARRAPLRERSRRRLRPGAGRSRGASTSCPSSTRRCPRFGSSTSCATAGTWPCRRTRTSSSSMDRWCSVERASAGGGPCGRSRSGAGPTAQRRTTASASSATRTCVCVSRICARNRAATIAAILGLFGLEGDAERMADAVRPPATLGRWRKKSRRLVEQLEQVGGEGLRRFGYL